MKRLVSKHPLRVLFLSALVGAGVLLVVATVFAQGGLTVSLKDSSRTTNEKAGFITLEVVLSASSTDTVTVQIATSDGTATAPSDYTSYSGTLTFAPGITSQTIGVEIIDGSASEQSENFTVTLSNAQNATIGTGTCTVTIEDGAGSSPAWVAFTDSSWTCNESDGTVTISVTMTGTPTADVSVDYKTWDGTAIAGSDYTATSGTLTWSKDDKVRTKTLTISITNDSDVEGAEIFYLVLSNPTNAALIYPSAAVVNILDDDLTCE